MPVCRSVRLKRVREKYEAELKEERAAVEKLLDQRKQQVEMEMELNRLRLLLRQKEHDIEDLVQVRVRHGSRLLRWTECSWETLCLVNLSADQRAAGGGTTQPGRAHQAGLCQPAGHAGGGEPQAEGGDDGAPGEGPDGGGEDQPREGGGACRSAAAVRRKP